MMITSRLHGVIDYLVAAILLLAPFLFGFADNAVARNVTTALGAVAFLYSLITRYELGVLPLLPYRLHLAVDVLFALVLAASPWLFGFAERIWWPHVVLAALGSVVVALSWRALNRSAPSAVTRETT